MQFIEDPETKKLLSDLKINKSASDLTTTSRQVKQDLQHWKILVK
jgi:hypothetical protein